MSFESKYRSENGADEFNKISNFLSGLIIKNNYEANAAATSESIAEYFKYYGAYSKIDSFSDYLTADREQYENNVYYYMNAIKDKPYAFTMATIKSLSASNIKHLQDGYNSGNRLYRDYLNALRTARVIGYDESNTYYRQFMGLPNRKADYIYIPNMDISDDGFTEVTDLSDDPSPDLEYFTKIDDKYISLGKITSWFDDVTLEKLADNFYIYNVIAIHELTYERFPMTFNYYIRQRNINKIIEQYPGLTYLYFIGKDHSPYYLHELPNYSIIQYDSGILTGTELEYFFKAYNKARQQVIGDYIEGFDKRQPLYNILMIQNLLYYTIINYTNSYIEKYSVGIYTERDLDNILNSHGYSKLTSISSYDIKYRIVKNLNELIENKGNNHILELILNKIIQDENSVLKRYYLEKEYITNELGEIHIDTSRGLENSVNLTLREIPVTELNESTSVSDTYVEFDQFVNGDNLWGGINEDDTEETKLTKKERLKKELLSLNFNSILTRYITLMTTIDILNSQKNLRDLLYLAFKYIDATDMKEFYSTKITVDTTSATPAALFGAMCWLQQMKFYSDPDKIVKNNIVINDSAVFRSFGKLVVDRQSFENTVIYDGKVLTNYDISPEISKWRITEFMKEHPDTFREFLSPSGVETERIETVRIKDTILQPEYKQTGLDTWTLTKPMIVADGYKNLTDKTETIEDSMPIYRFYANGVQLGEVSPDTTFGDLLEDYMHQMPNLIARITDKISESYDYNTFQAWTFLLNEARKDNSVLFIFKEYNNFSTFISEYCESGEFIDWLETQLKVPLRIGYRKPTVSDICTTLDLVSNKFKVWMNENISSEIYANENLSGNSSYIEDMRILFNEFLSVYSELYSVDFTYTLGDRETSDFCMCLYYNPTSVLLKQEFIENLELLEELVSEVITHLNSDDIDEDTLGFIYDYFSKATMGFNENVNNELIYDPETDEYTPEDQFKYEVGLKFETLLNEWVGFNDRFKKIHCKINKSDDIGFKEILKITTDKGVKYYDE